MTKKNATKGAARQRKARLGGKFLHHRRVVAGGGGSGEADQASALTVDVLQVVADSCAFDEVRIVREEVGDGQYVYVISDASSERGGMFSAMRIAQLDGLDPATACRRVVQEVRIREERGNLTFFSGVIPLGELESLLAVIAPDASTLKSWLDQLGATPPRGQVHAFFVTELEVAPGLTPLSPIRRTKPGPIFDFVHARSKEDPGRAAWGLLGRIFGRRLDRLLPSRRLSHG